MNPPLPRPTVALWRGLTKRCAVCGRGKLFRRWFTMAAACPRCGFRFEQREGAFLGSMSLNYGVAGVAFFIFLALWITLAGTPVEALPLTVGGIAVVTVALLVSFPFTKTLWAAFELLLRDPDDLIFDEVSPPA